jgi:hypothetical protein
MKTSHVLLVLCGALLAPAVFAADPFEGRITLNLTSGQGRPQTLDLAMKGRLQRVDMKVEGMAVGSIIDLDKRQVTVLMPDQQMFMLMALPPEAQAAEKQAQEGKLEKSGKTEKILGYLCQLFTLKADGKTTELWLAEGLGSFVGLGAGGNPMGGPPPPKAAWEQALAGVAGFPLRVVEKDAGGKELFRLEATKVDKSAQPAALFAPPAGYQKFDMGAMMQGLPPGMNPFKR